MKLHRTRTINPGFLIAAPLANVVFIVLMFFVLSSGYVLQPGIQIVLPESKFSLMPVHNPHIISLTAGTTPKIFYKDRSVTPDQLRTLLQEHTGSDQSVIIRADKQTSSALLYQVMDAALKEGYSVGLATAPEK